MNSFAKVAIVAASLVGVLAPSAEAAAFLPTGPKQDVSFSQVTLGGWSLCYSATMNTPFGRSAATALSACTGNRILVAGRRTGNSNLLVLAQTLKAEALTDTGAADNGIFTESNGTDWFNSDGWSFGFKPIDIGFTKQECTIFPVEYSLCLHTVDTVGGFSINAEWSDIIANGRNYEKLVFSMNDVPEPSVWAMLITGFGLVGAAARRRRQAVA